MATRRNKKPGRFISKESVQVRAIDFPYPLLTGTVDEFGESIEHVCVVLYCYYDKGLLTNVRVYVGGTGSYGWARDWSSAEEVEALAVYNALTASAFVDEQDLATHGLRLD